MEKSHGPIKSIEIPEEIVIEILRRLPLKSLHKFKWVAKSWYSLITEEVLPKTLNPQAVSFFGRTMRYGNFNDFPNGINGIGPEFSFLASLVSNLSIVDCCNGLLLCCTILDDYSQADYVCNPITKSWTKLPYIGCHSLFRRLDFNMVIDFDPYVSAHYKVFSVQAYRDKLRFDIYHSETRRLEHKWAHCAVSFLYGIIGFHCTVWNGEVYLYPRNAYYEVNRRTMRIAILEGNAVYPEFIDFSADTKLPSDGARIGKLGGRLCFAGLDGRRLRVWTLGGRCENEWVIEHESTICAPSKINLVGFHPLQNLVIILLDRVVFGYDLKEMSFYEIGQFELKIFERSSTSVFPFFPFLLDTLENQNSQ